MRVTLYSRRAILAGVMLALSGCAVNRSELKLDAPKVAAAKSGAPVLVIRTLSDTRVFSDNPKEPSMPSLGGDGVAKASADVKSRAVGRKRNGYGQALGDVLLDNGQTVTSIVRENVASALGDAGFAVHTGAGPPPASATTVDITIRQFWAWLEPGFTELTFHMDIDADLAFSGKGGKQAISVRSTDGRLAGDDNTWREVIQKGLVEFRQQTTAKAKAMPR